MDSSVNLAPMVETFPDSDPPSPMEVPDPLSNPSKSAAMARLQVLPKGGAASGAASETPAPSEPGIAIADMPTADRNRMLSEYSSWLRAKKELDVTDHTAPEEPGIDLIEAGTPKDLLAASVAGVFNPVKWANDNSERMADPVIKKKIADTIALEHERGWKFSDIDIGGAIMGILKLPGELTHWGAKVFEHAVVDPVGDLVMPKLSPDAQHQLELTRVRDSAELLASSETSLGGVADLAVRTAKFLGPNIILTAADKLKSKKPSEWTDEQKAAFMWDRVGEFAVRENTLRGHGVYTDAILGKVVDEAAREGIAVDPAEVTQLAAGDPIAFAAFGELFKVGTLAVKAGVRGARSAVGGQLRTIATTQTRAQAIALAERLRVAQADLAKAGADHAVAIESAGKGFDADVAAAKAKAGPSMKGGPGELPLVEGLVNLDASIPTRAAVLSAEAAAIQEKVVQERVSQASVSAKNPPITPAAGLLQRVYQAERNIAKLKQMYGTDAVTGAERAVDVGLATAATGVSAAARVGQFGTWMARGIAPNLIKTRVLTAAPDAFKTIAEKAAGVAGGIMHNRPELMSPALRLMSDTGKAVGVDVARKLSEGFVVDVSLSAMANETPEETRNTVFFATGLGGLSGIRFGAGRIVQGQLARERAYGPDRPLSRSGNFPDLDAATDLSLSIAQKPPGIQRRLNALRQALAPLGNEIFLATTPEAFENAIRKHATGWSEQRIQEAIVQQGVTLENNTTGKDGRTRALSILRELQPAEHEAVHSMLDIFSAEGRTKLADLARAHYVNEWEAIGENYTRRAVDPKMLAEYRARGENWRDALLDFTEGNPNWRDLPAADARTKADRYIAEEILADVGGNIIKNRGPDMLKAPGFPGKLARVMAGTMIGFGAEPFRGAKTAVLDIPQKFQAQEAVRRGLLGELENAADERAKRAYRAKIAVVPKGGSPPGGAAPPVTPKGGSPPGVPPAAPKTPEEAGRQAGTIADAQPTTPLPRGTRPAQEVARDIAQAISIAGPVQIDYAHAKGDVAAAIESGRRIRRAEIEAARGAPLSERDLRETLFYPEQMIQTGNGKVQILGWAPDVFAANAAKLAEAINASGKPNPTSYPIDPKTGRFTPDGWRILFDDAQQFAQNQRSGATGSGEPLVVPKSMTDQGFTQPVKVSEPGRQLNQDRADVISALFGIEVQKSNITTGRVYPRNLAGQAVSEATLPGRTRDFVQPRVFEGKAAEKAGVVGQPIREVNPFRSALEDAGIKPDFIEVMQRLNLDRVADVTPAPILVPPVRGVEFTLQAGFAPKPEGGAAKSPKHATPEDWAEWQRLGKRDLMEDGVWPAREAIKNKYGGAVPAPPADWRVSVQAAQGDMPGNVQLIDPRADENSQSPTVESLREAGHDVPDFSQLPQGSYSYADATAKLEKSTTQFAPSKDPRAIAAAAVEDADGKIYRGSYHGDAIGNAQRANARYIDGYSDPSWDVPYKVGFVDNSGNFRTRDEAYKIGVELGQVSADEVARHSRDDGDAIHTIDFKRGGAFAPSTEGYIGNVDEYGGVKAKWKILAENTHRSLGMSGVSGYETDAGNWRYNPETKKVYWGQEVPAKFVTDSVTKWLKSQEQPVDSHVSTASSPQDYRDAHGGSGAQGTPGAAYAPSTDAGRELEARGFTFATDDRGLIQKTLEERGVRAKSFGPALFNTIQVKNQEGHVIGNIMTSVDGDNHTSAKIDGVYVDEKYRKQGIAETLFREALDALKADGVKTVRGYVVNPAPLKILNRLLGPDNTTYSYQGEPISLDAAIKRVLPESLAAGSGGPKIVSKIPSDAKFAPKTGKPILGMTDEESGAVTGHTVPSLSSADHTHAAMGLTGGIQWRFNPVNNTLYWWEGRRGVPEAIRESTLGWLEKKGYTDPTHKYLYDEKWKGSDTLRNEANIEDSHADFAPKPNEDARKIAEDYMVGRGLPYVTPARINNVDELTAKRIAKWYGAAKHDPNSEEVRNSYGALIRETKDQYDAIKAAGYEMEPFTGKGEPYKSSDDMTADVRDNKHLFYLPTGGNFEGNADHPMLGPSGVPGLVANDVFRQVHDFMGHVVEGNTFGPIGELNAWRAHSDMYSPAAQGALAAETMGQNSWVNFGKHLEDEVGKIPKRGEATYVSPAERPFAEQKAVAMPQELLDAARAQFAPRSEDQKLSDEKFTPTAEDRLAPVKWMSPEEFDNALAVADSKIESARKLGKQSQVFDAMAEKNDLYQSQVGPFLTRFEDFGKTLEPDTTRATTQSVRGLQSQGFKSFSLELGSSFHDPSSRISLHTSKDGEYPLTDAGLRKGYATYSKHVVDAFNASRKSPDAQYGPRPNAVDKEFIDVEHLSSAPGLTSVNPKYFGRGKTTTTDLRGGNKSYFFVKGSKLGQDENLFGPAAKLNKYTGRIKGADLYDLRKGKPDPLNWRSTINREEADDNVAAAGYKGIMLDTADGRQVVAMFKPTPVTSRFAPQKPGDRPEDKSALPGFEFGRPRLSASEQAGMSKQAVRDHFPEAVVPSNPDETIPSNIVGSPLYKQAKDEPAAVKAFSDRLVEFAKQYEALPEYQLGAKWYSEFTPKLKQQFGADAALMAELLAATSPQTNPEVNFGYATDALLSLKSGRFKKLIPKYEEGLGKIADGSWEKWLGRNGAEGSANTPAAFLTNWVNKFNLTPTQSNGKLFGQHSRAVLQVLARRWMDTNAGPKTRNFVENLLGKSDEATIDLWADRTMRWAGYEGRQDRWRIMPENGAGVSDADFKFSQHVFADAAKQLGMKPSALQGALWFAEKKRWSDNGWGRLDLGSFQTELEKLPLLKAGFEQRVRTEAQRARIKPREQGTLDIQPRFK